MVKNIVVAALVLVGVVFASGCGSCSTCKVASPCTTCAAPCSTCDK